MQLTERGVEMTPSQIKRIIINVVRNNEELAKEGLKPVALNISGPAGLGKTSIIKQACEELNKRMVKISLSQLDELGDLTGFPLTLYEVKFPDGKIEWLAETPSKLAVNRQKAVYTGRQKMGYALPEWFEENKDAPNGCVLVLDDFSRAQTRFIQASMEIIDQMEYYSWRLPSNWSVVLTTNPSGSGYHVSGMDVAQQTRYAEVSMKFDKEDWARWAEETGIDDRAINFVLMYPETIEEGLKVGVNPRVAVQFFSLIHFLEEFDTKEARRIISDMGYMTVGKAFTESFIVFINNREDKLIKPEQILFDPEKEVLDTLRSQLTVNGEYRSAVAYTLSVRLINYLIKYTKQHTFDDQMADRLESITLNDIFPRDINYNLVRTLNTENATKFRKFVTRQSVIQYNLS